MSRNLALGHDDGTGLTAIVLDGVVIPISMRDESGFNTFLASQKLEVANLAIYMDACLCTDALAENDLSLRSPQASYRW